MMESAALRYGFEFSREDIGIMNLPSGLKAVMAYTWMVRYFACVGDNEPNVDEIHLDPVEEKAVWTVSGYHSRCNDECITFYIL